MRAPFTQEQIAELKAATKPLIEFLKRNCHPEIKIIVDIESAEVVEGLARIIHPLPEN